MRRYLSTKSRSNRDSVVNSEKNLVDPDDAEADAAERSTIASAFTTKAPEAAPAPVNLKVKRVDYYYSKWSRKWKYQTTSSNVIPELRAGPAALDPAKEDPWAQFCFVVVRTIPQAEGESVTFKVVVKSPYLLTACKEVIQEIPGLSWNSIPLELDPQLLLTFLPDFDTYAQSLSSKPHPSAEDRAVAASISSLLTYLRTDYRSTLASLTHLMSHGEITFELLYYLLVPRRTLLTRCPVTGEHRALALVSVSKVPSPCGMMYQLLCEGLDANDGADPNATGFFRTQSRVIIAPFAGTVKIYELDAFPLEYHPRAAEVRAELIERGRKWAGFSGVHHMYYNGRGGIRANKCVVKYNVNSRVMIDKANFKRLHPNYTYPIPKPDSNANNMQSPGWCVPASTSTIQIPLQAAPDASARPREHAVPTDVDLLIATPVLYGFSLADKLWLELNVAHVHPIEWNDDAFANLVLPPGRKMLLRSLIEAHNAELDGFDDFVKGKGRGLVVNLFGPPGVGKTLSAEATSEHVKRPLYVVGAADLGTQASQLDSELQRVFELATAWKAIVLIDEADVFLEQRSLHDLERNAMVACFLRYLEYYPGILMLTTNRVRTFDEAFLSRIHVALHFAALDRATRRQIWQAFLARAGGEGVSAAQLEELAGRELNGRQVKNATRTAKSLALSRGEALRFEHVQEVLSVMEEFEEEFKTTKLE